MQIQGSSTVDCIEFCRYPQFQTNPGESKNTSPTCFLLPETKHFGSITFSAIHVIYVSFVEEWPFDEKLR